MSKYNELIFMERKANRISQADLAKEIGLHTGTLVDIELGRLDVDEGTWSKANDAMNKMRKKKEAA